MTVIEAAEVITDICNGLSQSTVSCTIHETGYYSHVAHWNFILKPKHRLTHIEWANENLNRSGHKGVYSDKSSFNLKFLTWIWVVHLFSSLAHDEQYASPKMTSGWDSLMVWGALVCGKHFPLMHVDVEILMCWPDYKGKMNLKLSER